ESGIEPQPLRLVSRDQTPSQAAAFLSIIHFILIVIIERQQRAFEQARFQPQTAGARRQKFKTGSAAHDLMLPLIKAEEVIPANNARAIHNSQGKVNALGERQRER